MTAILQLPMVNLTADTAANEDWRDSVFFTTAGQAVPYAAPANVGNGVFSGVGIAAGAWVGDYTVTMTGPTTYQVRDPDGYVLGAGLLGVPWSRSGLTFNLFAGSTPFVSGDTLAVSVLPTPIDLTGLTFEMDVKVGTGSGSYLYASTANSLLVSGGPTGVLGLAVPGALMVPLPPGALVADILAHGDGITRRCVTIAITHSSGVTAPR